MYNEEKGRCCIQDGDILSIGEFKILFTTENNKPVAKDMTDNENLHYHDNVNFDEMFTDLILNNLPSWDIKVERNNKIVFKSRD